jgi:hypothetical protein
MAVSGVNWDTAWTTSSINGSAVSNAGSANTAAIDNDGKWATEVSVQVAYGATASQGLRVFVDRDIDGTNYETGGSKPWGFEMPKAVSTTFYRTFTVQASEVSKFRVRVTNDSGASVTVTVRTRQATLDTN